MYGQVLGMKRYVPFGADHTGSDAPLDVLGHKIIIDTKRSLD
jgi:hypothetical protein